jgi:anti-sigma regulatory factor (Ser/Thr protein kinase)
MPGESSKKFVFNNNADALYPLSMDIVEYVKQKINPDEAVIQKLKMVLIELLTNAIKHSGNNEAIIEVSTTANSIILKKTDQGNTFATNTNTNSIKLEWPLPGNHHTGRVVSIYGDDNYTLKGKLENNCNISFFIEEDINTEVVDNAILFLPEHFGLMIITRACKSFMYQFDIDTCTNNFIATINTRSSN